MIVVIDYGMGNLGSIMNMFKKIGAEAVLTSDPAEIEKAAKIVLPGVGAFDAGMKKLEDLGLIPVLNHKVIEDKTPTIGVCLGMQLLTNSSEEGNLPGLGWIDAKTVKFSFNAEKSIKNKIPHMGWNTVEIKKQHAIFENMYPEPRFYFVHSYHVRCNDRENILTETFHGYSFTSSITQGNITGVQFHPEKSHKFGMKLLNNFACQA